MDPGRVVWLPGSGFDQGDADLACGQQFGGNFYACEIVPEDGGSWVYCCPY
jgi:hypothetical protein